MIAVERHLRACRRRLAVLCAVLALGGSVAWTHGGLAVDHMGTATIICLAVLDAVATAGLALVAVLRIQPPPNRLTSAYPLLAFAAPAPVPRARAGPPRLQVFRR